MTRTIRIAVRRFDPFENALRRQFADFLCAGGADARLETEVLDLDALHARLFAAQGLRDGSFDLAFLPTDWIAQAQAAELVQDLRPYLVREPIADYPGAWTPSLLEPQHFRGGFWGIPYHDGPECLIYRKDLLQAAALPVPRTWAEFHAAARRLHAPEKGCYGTALALYPDGHNAFYDFCIHVWTRGGELFASDGRVDLRTPQAAAALDFLRRLAGDGAAIAPGAQQLDSVKSGILFCEGQVALMSNWFGFAAFGERSPQSRVKGLIDVAPLPTSEGGRSVSLNVFWMLALAAGSPNPNLAWSFLRHVATAPMDKLTTLEGAVGVRRSTWSDPEINRLIPYFHKLDGLHAQARELPVHPRLADIAHVIDGLLTRAVSSDAPSPVLLGEAQRRVEDLLQ